MKKVLIAILLFGCIGSSYANEARKELKKEYLHHCHAPSDINQHLPHLRRIARECSSVVELGVRSMVSTWALLQGLAENPKKRHSYVGIDLSLPQTETFQRAQNLCSKNGITFSFILANDMHISVPPTDLLFIDTLHTYQHLTYELEKFSSQAKKYIALHDTAEPFGLVNDFSYHGDFSEYPSFIDRKKQGLWVAVTDFLMHHPEWKLYENHTNNHGLSILKRKANSP